MVIRHRRLITGALLLSNIMAGMDGTIVNTALPAITSDLHALQIYGVDCCNLPVWDDSGVPPCGVNLANTAVTVWLMLSQSGCLLSVRFFRH